MCAGVPHILLGALVGIVFILLAPSAIGLLAKGVGVEWGRLVYILAAVYAIVAFGEIVPVLLNNYTFLFFTVCGTCARSTQSQSLRVGGHGRHRRRVLDWRLIAGQSVAGRTFGFGRRAGA